MIIQILAGNTLISIFHVSFEIKLSAFSWQWQTLQIIWFQKLTKSCMKCQQTADTNESQLLDLISSATRANWLSNVCEWGSTIPHLIAPRYEETWNLEGQWKKNDACIAPKESSFTEKVNVHLLNQPWYTIKRYI